MLFKNKKRQELLKHTRNNHDEVLQSGRCGCLGCCGIFPAEEVAEWVDEPEGEHPGKIDRTAICPHCGDALIIGDKGGYEITPSFLEAMRMR